MADQKDIYLSVVIPAYNEAERLPATLVDIDAHLHDAPYEYEIIVMNDASSDNTAEVVSNFIGKIKNLKLMGDKPNQGKGGVVRDGMLAAQGKYRLFTDADNSTSIVFFKDMVPWFAQGFQVVIGSREAKGSKLDPPQPFYKRLLGRLANLVIQAVNVPGVWDTQCGFKAFTAEAAEKVFRASRLNGWGFDIEALALARSFGYKIKEIPVVWKNDLRSHVKLSAYLKTFAENLKIRWWFITDAYGLRRK